MPRLIWVFAGRTVILLVLSRGSSYSDILIKRFNIVFSIFQDSQGKKSFAKSYINEMAKEAVFTDRKRNELNKIWSQIFYEMVYSALSDMADIPSYSKKILEELEKT